MAASQHERRDISHSQFGDNAVLNQNNVHFHLPRPPARAGVARVIPYQPNDDLVYRRDLVEKLDELLPVAPGFYSAALWGLGGSGKTQIALDYAYRRCNDDQCSVFWVHADSEATFTSDYKTIGKELGVDESLEGPYLLDAVRSRIEGQSRWVLILDNADDLKLFGPAPTGGTRGMNEGLFRHIPRGSQGTILWTSRDAHIAGTLVSSRRGIKVASMTRDEAKALLATAMGEESVAEETGVDQLLEELQWLPLAVSQAGAYIRQTSMTIKKYLDELFQGASRWDLLKMDDYDRHRRPEVPNSVLETWSISTKRIREESELSYRILHVAAYLDSQEIPRELMVAAGQYRGSDGNGDKQATELDLRHAFTRLIDFSFLSTRRAEDGRQTYEMHKLVQEAVRYGLWAQGAEEAALGKATAQESGLGNKEAYYSKKYDEAEPLAKLALGRLQEVLGERHQETMAGVAILGLIYRAQGRLNEAETLQKQALDLQQKMLGERHPNTISYMLNIAGTYQAQGRQDEAKSISKKALDLLQETLGEKHPATAITIAELGALCCAQGQLNEGEALTKQALDLHQEVLGGRRSDTIMAMKQLARIYQAQGRHDEAKDISTEILHFQQEMTVKKHFHTILKMTIFGLIGTPKDQYNERGGIILKFLGLMQEWLGEKHPSNLTIMELLAKYYYRCRYDESKELMVKALKLRQEVLGENHPDTIKTMARIAKYYNRDRDDKQASSQINEQQHPGRGDAGESGKDDERQPAQEDKQKPRRRSSRKVTYVKTRTSKRRRLRRGKEE
ncbi:hypothetical protein TARUN_4701 [Trichoderma arundinaceum]|uniref:Uncharacterized protein n=1 Tax=Trichoderma arundinaceum TaxID=490622 RepID=A0A395NNR3_TRIAR|nr:hypothetical protein TARUN_4701 [Trichoderma arundinaceum]